MLVKLSMYIAFVTVVSMGCNSDRSLAPNTHDDRVPDIINLAFTVDSNASKQKIVTLTWGYDTVQYGTDRIKANLRDWEVYSANDTLQLSPKGRPTSPKWIDMSNAVQPGGNDSVVVFYKIFPNGYAIDNIQFVGKPTKILRVVIKK